MKERGQVFTIDMFFALAITALLVSYSGVAFEQARRQSEDYALRYSLERTANDAADVMLKTAGRPENWEENADNLEVVGLAEDENGVPIHNLISVSKFGQFRRLMNNDNWYATVNENAVDAIKNLFGGTEKFEVRVIGENGDVLWRTWPRWDVENSGVENSTEVVTVRRPVAMRYGSNAKVDTGIITKGDAGLVLPDDFWFEIFEGELDAFDFYIYVIGNGDPSYTLKILVNKTAGDFDYQYRTNQEGSDGFEIFPGWHGGVESDNDIDNNLQVGMNFLHLKFTGNWGFGRVYLIGIPTCSNQNDLPKYLEPLQATLEVKMWR